MVATPSTRERSLPPGFPEALQLPMALAGTLRLTPEEIAEVCAANPGRQQNPRLSPCAEPVVTQAMAALAADHCNREAER